jgi:EAL domain-containing protein (putative c-di-GMP-specific phosphodiesterase class I)
MYQAKMRGKARIAIYDAQMGARVVERNDLESRMRHAIDRDEFKVYYQPQVELASGQISGFEALVRWESAEGELLLPDHFLPVAEESGLIVQLGRRVLAQAGRQATIWQQEYPSMPIRVSVNLSERQFQFPGLIDDIAAVLDTNALKPANLLLEVTESALMNVGETNAHTLRRLKELGVQLAIDDFGIGYSRLSNLKQYPVDVLKIDRSFVNRIAQNPEDAAIVGAITTLAHTLNTRVIAEGIETSSQLARLRDLGCDQGQGYLFASPLNADEASEMLAQTA